MLRNHISPLAKLEAKINYWLKESRCAYMAGKYEFALWAIRKASMLEDKLYSLSHRKAA